MTLEELEEAGVLLPEENWGKIKTESVMSWWVLAPVAIFAIVSILMMLIGDGKLMTFVGIGLFLMDLFFFTAYGVWAINKQNEILDQYV